MLVPKTNWDTKELLLYEIFKNTTRMVQLLEKQDRFMSQIEVFTEEVAEKPIEKPKTTTKGAKKNDSSTTVKRGKSKPK